ncbi:MAG: thiolase family protein [Candidatus Dadabacteria bacterium]|nr:MAG: thiolase family protein [Candidatus Dadabacteria bacterium]
MKEAVIVAANRTAVGKANKGSLVNVRPDDLAGLVLKDVVERAGIDAGLVEDLQMGCAFPEGEQGLNMGRIATFIAGFPHSVPGSTVNRFCSSGLQSIAIIANRIQVGEIECGIGAGAESMSMVPMGGNKQVPNPALAAEFPEAYISMGHTAENVATRYGISREEQDRWAAISNERAVAAIESGAFKDQIVPVQAWRLKADKKTKEYFTFDTDEGPRKGTTPEVLAKLRPVFATNGSVTAGNASQMSDGAAAVLLMSRERAEKEGLKPMARFVTFAVVGCHPDEMGIGPALAVPKALQQAGLSVDDIDLFEINEAFASQFLYSLQQANIPEDKVNVNGGAIALGHPLGCTGAKLTTQLVYELERRNGRYGVVSMCIGGGMGAAAVYERLS